METKGFTIRAITEAIHKFFHPITLAPREDRPELPSKMGRHKFRKHAPSDGRWHMKYHRSRR